MATVYPTAAGNWSTRTWNDDATGSAYGGPPLAGDVVLANNLSITIDQDVTVSELRTTAGTTAAAGGNFSTSGARTVNANVVAGTTTCYTGNNTSILNGSTTGGSATNARGAIIQGGGIQNGNATGGTAANANGTLCQSGGILNGNSVGGAFNVQAAFVQNGGIQNGNATGGTAAGAVGTLVASGGFFNGNATGGTVNTCHGVIANGAAVVVVSLATGTVSGAFGVSAGQLGNQILIRSTSGDFPSSIAAGNYETNINVPFIIEPSTGGLPIGRLISGGV
jgi:hypothetical protein